MKLLSSLSLLAGLAALSPFASAQIEVATTPVGVVPKAIPAGNTVVASLFVNASSFQGSSTGMTEVGENTVISFDAPGFVAGEFDEGFYPVYFAEVVSGEQEGMAFDVISNDASSITVMGLAKTDRGLNDVEAIAIHRHITVGQFFEDAEGLTAFGDSVKFFNPDATDSSYLYTGDGNWTDGVNDATNRPIYPGVAFVATFGNPVDIQFAGTVKTTATQIPVYAVPGVINLAANNYPVEQELGELGLATQLVAYGETIKFYNEGTLTDDISYLSTGTEMSADGATSADGDPVLAGRGFLLSVGSSRYITIPAQYGN